MANLSIEQLSCIGLIIAGVLCCGLSIALFVYMLILLRKAAKEPVVQPPPEAKRYRTIGLTFVTAILIVLFGLGIFCLAFVIVHLSSPLP